MTLSKRHSKLRFCFFFSSLIVNNVVVVNSSGSKGQLTVPLSSTKAFGTGDGRDVREALLTCRFATGSLPGYSTSGEESTLLRRGFCLSEYHGCLSWMTKQIYRKVIASAELCISQFQAWPSPRVIFLMGEFPTPGKKGVQNPTPRAYKNELKPHPWGIFSIIHYKNMKKMRQKSCKTARFYHLQMIKR